MHRGLILAWLTAFVAAGCETTGGDAGSAAPPRADPSPRSPVGSVMGAKLDLAQSLLAGLARGEFDQVEANARQLEILSREAAWMITDSVTYVLYSEQFRETAAALAEHARDGNVDRATLDFMQLTQTCVACHTYLRRERLARDYPERVTLLPPPWPEPRP